MKSERVLCYVVVISDIESKSRSCLQLLYKGKLTTISPQTKVVGRYQGHIKTHRTSGNNNYIVQKNNEKRQKGQTQSQKILRENHTEQPEQRQNWRYSRMKEDDA